jgi:hypothetical protein
MVRTGTVGCKNTTNHSLTHVTVSRKTPGSQKTFLLAKKAERETSPREVTVLAMFFRDLATRNSQLTDGHGLGLDQHKQFKILK